MDQHCLGTMLINTKPLQPGRAELESHKEEAEHALDWAVQAYSKCEPLNTHLAQFSLPTPISVTARSNPGAVAPGAPPAPPWDSLERRLVLEPLCLGAVTLPPSDPPM